MAYNKAQVTIDLEEYEALRVIASRDTAHQRVTVREVDRYRDGGTVVYQDILNRKYFTYNYPQNKKVYNDIPYPRGYGTSINPSIQEIPVELEIVESP